MLSYQHGYHAGNFADVIKHMGLNLLLNYLTRKDKPLFYLETHSGGGLYDLQNQQAEKTGEYKQGIKLLWCDKALLPPIFHDYLKIISQINHHSELTYYPGSPFLVINKLRMQDRIYFCELHPREFEALNKLAHLNKKVYCNNTDGIAAMNALLPPAEKRGLIFVDPSFELKEEYKEIPAAIKRAYKRFSTGVFCLWYPLVHKKLTEKLTRGMQEINAKNALRIEFNLSPTLMKGLSGCGLWVINPPFTFSVEIKAVLDVLKTYFNPGISSYFIASSP